MTPIIPDFPMFCKQDGVCLDGVKGFVQKRETLMGWYPTLFSRFQKGNALRSQLSKCYHAHKRRVIRFICAYTRPTGFGVDT